jgi:hypothetical protein
MALKQKEIMEEKQRRRSEQIHEGVKEKKIAISNKKSPFNLRTKSNISLVKNALMHVCLAGSVHKAIKEEVLQVLLI